MPDDLFERVRARFSEAQLVELAAHVALADVRARTNALFHVPPHGLYCHLLPLAKRPPS